MGIDPARVFVWAAALSAVLLACAVGAAAPATPVFPLKGAIRPFTGDTRRTAPAIPGAYRIAEPAAWYYEWPTPPPAFAYNQFQGRRTVGKNQEPGYDACRPTSELPHGCGRPHRGLDIYAHYGTPIVAPESGVIIGYQGSDVFAAAGKESKNGGAGRLFRLRGDSGHLYTFMHTMGLSESVARQAGVAKDFGDTTERPIRVPVAAGEVIGYVGRTGGIVNPHLHLQVTRDGREVDPGAVIGPAPGSQNPVAGE